MSLTRPAIRRPAIARLTFALIIALAATLVTGGALAGPATAAKAKTWIISPSGVGPVKPGMTAKKMKKSKLFIVQQAQNCDGSSYSYVTFKPGLSDALGVSTTTKGTKLAPANWWSGKDKITELYVWAAKAENHRLQTKRGIKVGSTVKALLKKEKHLTKTKNLKKYYPQVWEKSGKHYLVFFFSGWSNSNAKLTTWAAVKKQKITGMSVSNVKPKQYTWANAGGSGGC